MLALVGSGEYLPPMEPVDRQLIEKLDECATGGVFAHGSRSGRRAAHRLLE